MSCEMVALRVACLYGEQRDGVAWFYSAGNDFDFRVGNIVCDID